MSEQVDTQERVIAVPSLAPGGLEAQRSGHFGHCDFFTLVEIGGDSVAKVRVVENAPHHEGGCLDPVNLLASLGATEIVVGGMGARPLSFFGEMGITVYADQELPTVREVVDALLQGTVPVMSAMQVCGGGSCH
ncbi:MAG: NifB/NifX family molybdenum-iron cluster-binding protein [Thermoleophilia bacterium]